MGLLNIEIKAPIANVNKRSKSYSFASQIAAIGKIFHQFLKEKWLILGKFIGGTIGLFTGTSILSVVEILFWIKRLISKLI